LIKQLHNYHIRNKTLHVCGPSIYLHVRGEQVVDHLHPLKKDHLHFPGGMYL